MIVRPSGALPSQRTRSQSTPPRRRANSTGSALAKEAQTAVSQLPASPLRILPGPLGVAPKHSGGAPEDSPLRTFSTKRRLFRLKRPSSSHADPRAAREREGTLHVQMHNTHNALGITALISPPASPVAPPRPPRNPARVNLAARPSSSGGPPARISRLHIVADSRELKATEDAAAEWEFPLPVSTFHALLAVAYLGRGRVRRGRRRGGFHGTRVSDVTPRRTSSGGPSSQCSARRARSASATRRESCKTRAR